jgi:hypothetical protein
MGAAQLDKSATSQHGASVGENAPITKLPMMLACTEGMQCFVKIGRAARWIRVWTDKYIRSELPDEAV